VCAVWCVWWARILFFSSALSPPFSLSLSTVNHAYLPSLAALFPAAARDEGGDHGPLLRAVLADEAGEEGVLSPGPRPLDVAVGVGTLGTLGTLCALGTLDAREGLLHVHPRLL
jgi:hypothetical protein